MSAIVTMPAAYGISRLTAEEGMSVLRNIFPDGEADEFNLCIFSCSGVHGSYESIEDVAASLDTDEPNQLTVVVFHPRTVFMHYGHINVAKDDIPYLLKLRESSRRIFAEISQPTPIPSGIDGPVSATPAGDDLDSLARHLLNDRFQISDGAWRICEQRSDMTEYARRALDWLRARAAPAGVEAVAFLNDVRFRLEYQRRSGMDASNVLAHIEGDIEAWLIDRSALSHPATALSSAQVEIADLRAKLDACDCKRIGELAGTVGMTFVSWKDRAESAEQALEAAAAEKRVLLDALAEAAEAFRQLEVLGPFDGAIWLHLRPGKGLVSIRIEEAPMVEAYLDWFERVKRVRAALADAGRAAK